MIDKRFLEAPLCTARQMKWHLQNKGHVAGKKLA